MSWIASNTSLIPKGVIPSAWWVDGKGSFYNAHTGLEDQKVCEWHIWTTQCRCTGLLYFYYQTTGKTYTFIELLQFDPYSGGPI